MGSNLSKQPSEATSSLHPAAKYETSASAAPVANNNDNKSWSPSAPSSGGGCPMQRKDGSYSFDVWALFRPQFPHGPGGSRPMTEKEAREKVNETGGAPTTTDAQQQQQQSRKKESPTAHMKIAAASSSSGCPVKASSPPSSSGCPIKGQNSEHPEYNVYSQPLNTTNNMPSQANQLPAAIQTKPLSTDRVKSSIPKGGATAEVEDKTWVYPSPQMFYNALARKGKLADTDEQDIDTVVAMHNNMNEKTWKKVLQWEEVIGEGSSSTPKLLKFMGRPTDLSPKAMLKHYILGYPLPYDRHDWTVLRSDGTTLRYVIDYYYDETRASDSPESARPALEDEQATKSLLVDVRPALDSPTQLFNRLAVMPYARRIAQSTPFTPLPLMPTSEMKSQVSESVQVWKNIQLSASGGSKSSNDEGASETGDSDGIPILDESQAKDLKERFGKIMDGCQQAQTKVEKCSSEMECARASMDLTICMAQFACPLQYGALLQSLAGEGANDDDNAIDTALTNVSECVSLQSALHAVAKHHYPELFQQSSKKPWWALWR